MYLFVIYILKVSVCLTLFYLFFKVLLSKETFHRINRTVLISLISLAFIVPIIPAPFDLPEPLSPVVNQIIRFTDEQATLATTVEIHQESVKQAIVPQATQQPNTTYNYVSLLFIGLFILYICGAIVALIKLIVSMRTLRQHIKLSTTKRIGKYILVIHPSNIAPYSWFRYIVISEKDLQEAKDEILAHEMAHSDKFHSLDILLIEVMILLQWFNPAAYLLKQELQAIHEYEADLEVLNKGFHPKQYQLLLIKKAVGTSSYTLANSFNHSSLKKRIAMMLKCKSNRWAMMKIGFFIPLTASMLAVFSQWGNAADVVNNPVVAEPEVSTETHSNNKVNETSVLNPLLQSESFANETTTANQAASTQEVCIKSTGQPFLQYVIDQMYATSILQTPDNNIRSRLYFSIDSNGKIKTGSVEVSSNGLTASNEYLIALDDMIKNAPALTGKVGKEYHLTYAAYGTKRLVGVGSEYTIFEINKPQSEIKYIQSTPPALQDIKLDK